MPRAAKPTPRRRLDAEAARKLILDVTEQRLVRVGPSGIRLQDVAEAAEISHSTVLHHFGNREQLVNAVITRILGALNASLVEAIVSSNGDRERLATLMEKTGATLERAGYARVLLWLALEGEHVEPDVRLGHVVDAVHAVRLSRIKRGKKPTREDTAHAVMLGTLALVGGSVLAKSMLENVGLPNDEAGIQKFRRWVTRFMLEHME